jgi:hypothetical protein
MRVLVEPGADPDAEILVRRDVLPALRSAIGASLQLPTKIVLAAHAGHGVVGASIDRETGAILQVNSPSVGSLGPPHLVRWVAAHELGHFHELSVRRARNVATGDFASSVFWTEYYANRTTWRAGFGISATDIVNLVVPDGPYDGEKSNADSADVLGPLYALALTLAEADAHPARNFDGEDCSRSHIVAMQARSERVWSRFYDRFPRWPEQAVRTMPAATKWLRKLCELINSPVER